MSIIALDPLWVPLTVPYAGGFIGYLPIAGTRFVGTTEILSKPVPLAGAGPGQLGGHAQFIALKGFVVSQAAASGPLVAAMDLRTYRTPNADRLERETVPTYTKTIAAGGVTGAELVTNGDFALGTGWRMGSAWSIAGGVALTSAAPTDNELWRAITLPGGSFGTNPSGSGSVKFLLTLDLVDISSDGRLNVSVEGDSTNLDALGNPISSRDSIRQYTIFDLTTPGAPNAKAGIYDASKKISSTQALVIACQRKEPGVLDAQAVTIDNVSFKHVTPLNFCDVRRADELGDGVTYGFLPAAAYDNAYLWAWYRRFMEV